MAIKGFWTTAEAAERLGIAQSYVYFLIKKQRLKAVRVGEKVLLVDAESARKFRPRPRGRPRKGSVNKPRPTKGWTRKEANPRDHY